MNKKWAAAGFLAALPAAAWAGLQVEPPPFSPYPEKTPELEMVDLPPGLPEPVERFYRAISGNRIPLIRSAVLSGRARLRISGIPFPGRFRFTHIAGQSYRHYIEATVFGKPLMKVNEHFIDGRARVELPMGTEEDHPNLNQAANLALWAEAVWLPPLWVTDPRVRWEAVDAATALLQVPYRSETETFVMRFDPQTGLLRYLEAMRFRETSDQKKTPWVNEGRNWKVFDSLTIPEVGAVTWLDQGRPWAVFRVEEVVYNADVSEYIRAAGQ